MCETKLSTGEHGDTGFVRMGACLYHLLLNDFCASHILMKVAALNAATLNRVKYVMFASDFPAV